MTVPLLTRPRSRVDRIAAVLASLIVAAMAYAAVSLTGGPTWACVATMITVYVVVLDA